MAAVAPVQVAQIARADQYDDRIRAIQAEIDQYQAKAGQLKDRADSLQKEVSAITAQKNVIQGQINLKQAEHDRLVVRIQENEQKISDSQDALGSTIANIYVDDKISPLEMLASSNSISDYVDKQEFRATVRDQLTETIAKIRELKRQLESQKKEIERVLAEQQFARNALAAKETEHQSLLNQTRGQEAAYQQLTASREQQKLQAQQAQQAAIRAAERRAGGNVNVLASDPNKGGYPWEAGCTVDANAVSHGGADGRGGDPLGYGCRQCVSYTAYKVGAYLGGRDRDYPRYWGNANQWPGSARAAGFKTSAIPRVNSVGVMMEGDYGHVVWVEAVNDVNNNGVADRNDTVDISQYNYLNAGGSGWGHYSKMRVPVATYDTYIYF